MSNDSRLSDDGQLTSRTLIGEGRYNEGITVGEDEPSVAAGVDWLQVTMHADCEPCKALPDFLAVSELQGAPGEDECPGWVRQLNYNRCARLLPGGFLMWHSENRSQGFHLRLNGSEIALLRSQNSFLDEMLIDWLRAARSRWRVNVSRLDLFVDLIGGECPVKPLGLAVIDGSARSRARFEHRASATAFGEAWTVYCGLRKSGKRLRIYDKAREVAVKTGRFEGERTRIEIEFRGDYANVLLDDDLSTVGIVTLVLNTAANMAQFPVGWWEQLVLMGNARRLVRVVHDGDKDTMAWLKRTAIPALRNAAAKIDDFETLESVVACVVGAYKASPKARRLLSSGYLRRVLSVMADGGDL